jgi:hypothetical protein
MGFETIFSPLSERINTSLLFRTLFLNRFNVASTIVMVVVNTAESELQELLSTWLEII